MAIRDHKLFRTEYTRFSAVCFAGLILFFCFFLALCQKVAPDGAFNLQAAANLFSKGTLELDYRPNRHLQTLLPFQAFNGLFIAIFGRYLSVVQFASIFFLIVFALLVVRLAKRYSSSGIFLSCGALILSPTFTLFGTSGLGEVPALVYGLVSIYILCFHHRSVSLVILSGMLLGLCLSTKVVLHLILPSVVLTLLLLNLSWLKRGIFVLASLTVYIPIWVYQLSFYSRKDKQIFAEAIKLQSMPRHGTYGWELAVTLSDYLDRFIGIWVDYSSLSIGIGAYLKVVMLVFTIGAAVHLFFRSRMRDEKHIYFLFLSCFLLTYFLWAFFLNSQWIGRRTLNVDVLLFLCLGLAPALFAMKRSLLRSYIVVLAILLCYDFVWLRSVIGECRRCSLTDLDRGIKNLGNHLPEQARLYGFSRLEAPVTKFLLKRDTSDLFNTPIFSDCFRSACDNYLIKEPLSDRGTASFDLIQEVFALTKVNEFEGYQIFRLNGFNTSRLVPTSRIDFSDEQAVQDAVISMHRRTRSQIYGASPIEIWERVMYLGGLEHSQRVEVAYAASHCITGAKLKVGLWINDFEQVAVHDLEAEERLSFPLPVELVGKDFFFGLFLDGTTNTQVDGCGGRYNRSGAFQLKSVILQ